MYLRPKLLAVLVLFAVHIVRANVVQELPALHDKAAVILVRRLPHAVLFVTASKNFGQHR
jgi:hypothetical protein